MKVNWVTLYFINLCSNEELELKLLLLSHLMNLDVMHCTFESSKTALSLCFEAIIYLNKHIYYSVQLLHTSVSLVLAMLHKLQGCLEVPPKVCVGGGF